MSSKTTWPRTVRFDNAAVKVTKTINGAGNPRFRIIYRDTDGRRVFESATDEDKALARAKQQAEILSTHGARVAEATPEQIAEIIRLGDLLQPFNVTLSAGVQALAGWLKTHHNLESLSASIQGIKNSVVIEHRSVAEAVEEIIKAKEENGACDAYVGDLRRRYRKFAASFACEVSSVTGPMVQQWLDALDGSNHDYMKHRGLLSVFFNFCKKRGYCAANLAEETDSRKFTHAEAQVYTADEFKKLLNAFPMRSLAGYCIAGFAGLRIAEIARLCWQDVNLPERHIIVSAGIAKTSSRRVVPISDNLAAWLEKAKPAGAQPGHKIWEVSENILTWEHDTVSEKAGVPWKNNAMRHSFCSYRLAVLRGDYVKTAFEAGNSPKMIQKHYQALVTEAQAKAWFEIMP